MIITRMCPPQPPPPPPTPRSTLTQDYQRDWPRYFDAVQGQPPRDTLVRALNAFEREGLTQAHMIDLACGEGRDTREALRRTTTRWTVTAIESSEDGLQRLAASLGSEAPRVHALAMAMEQVATSRELLPPTIHLINASFALPFCTPSQFPTLWRWIRTSLAPGGRFAGQFFGDRDEWAIIRPKSHVTRAELDSLLAGLAIEHLDEVEKDGSDAMGGVKHHHVFHVVARA
jgi:tellurite methyltransferase